MRKPPTLGAVCYCSMAWPLLTDIPPPYADVTGRGRTNRKKPDSDVNELELSLLKKEKV